MKNSQKGIVPIIIVVILGIVVGTGTYFLTKYVMKVNRSPEQVALDSYDQSKRDSDNRKRLEDELNELIKQSKTCEVDSDCIIIHTFSLCPEGGTAVNKKSNIAAINAKNKELTKSYEGRVSQCIADSIPAGTPHPSCVAQRCEVKYE